MSKTLSVTVIENGPLKIAGDDLSVNHCGDPVTVEAGKPVFLCRCGHSQNPPFCDQSHRREGFVAEAPSGEAKEIRVWEGRTIRTFFNPTVCMHVFYCKPLKELRQAELDGDDAAAAEIARVVQSCPSGALTYEAQSTPAPAPTAGPDVDIMEGGEVRIQCAFEINAELGERQPNDRGTLCRCGLSTNKPWCDGRHKKRENFR